MERRLVPVKLDSYKPLREIVLEALREAIVSGVLEPGERLMEIQLAEEMGVSRTPVREAIRKLELEGFVVMIPRKGAYVAGVSHKDVQDVFEIRRALEVLAAGLAAEKATDEEIEQMERALHYDNEPKDRKSVV
jgi:DNA-binding GntR family transcriptional regulator